MVFADSRGQLWSWCMAWVWCYVRYPMFKHCTLVSVHSRTTHASIRRTYRRCVGERVRAHTTVWCETRFALKTIQSRREQAVARDQQRRCVAWSSARQGGRGDGGGMGQERSTHPNGRSSRIANRSIRFGNRPHGPRRWRRERRNHRDRA